MPEYSFEVQLVATVSVEAEDENLARAVVISSALESPGPEEISLANQANFLAGKSATSLDIKFRADKASVKSVQQLGAPATGKLYR
jgi:hypothetical protein